MVEIAVYKPTNQYKGEVLNVDDTLKDYTLQSYTEENSVNSPAIMAPFTPVPFSTDAVTRRMKLKFLHWTLSTRTGTTSQQVIWRIYLKGILIGFAFFTGPNEVDHQVIKFDEPVYMDVGETMTCTVAQLDGLGGGGAVSINDCRFGFFGIEVKY